MKRSILFLIVLFCFCSGTNSNWSGVSIYSIKVMDADFKPVKNVGDSSQLFEIMQMLQNAEPVSKFTEKPNWTYKINIASNKMAGRWQYDTAGIIAKLNFQNKPAFQVKNKQRFTEILKKSRLNL
jgi:hypothetical protein